MKGVEEMGNNSHGQAHQQYQKRDNHGGSYDKNKKTIGGEHEKVGGRPTYSRSAQELFVNPYTFVSIDTKKTIRSDAEGKYGKSGLISGYLECSLKAVTPIAIPDTEMVQMDGKHKVYGFFKLPSGKYAIPGSSVRGVVRNVFETATNSCMSTMNDEYPLTLRTSSKNAYKPALLIKNGAEWQLYAVASKNEILCDSRFKKAPLGTPVYTVDGNSKTITLNGKVWKSGDCVHFDTMGEPYEKPRPHTDVPDTVWDDYVKTIGKGPKEGYIFIGEAFPRKHGEEIFEKGERLSYSEKEIIEALGLVKKSLNIYRNKAINKDYKKKHQGYPWFEDAEKRGVIPLWYSEIDGALRFSMASIGRSFGKKTLNDLVGEKRPCASRNNLCAACSLFGMIGDNDGLGSRVRFTDAIAVGNIFTKRRITLCELGSPRYSYLPFYGCDSRKHNVAISSYDEDYAAIRGRKYYWHNCAVATDSSLYTSKEKTERNASMELADNGSEFTFRVYYDNITEEQLKMLEWSITLGENSIESTRCHKIGHGKPLGLGSCKILIKSDNRRTIDDNMSYKFTSNTDTGNLNGDMGGYPENKELLKACDLNAISDNCRIEYPRIIPKDEPQNVNDGARHKWFTENNSRRNGGPVPQMLPDIMADKQGLQLYELSYK